MFILHKIKLTPKIELTEVNDMVMHEFLKKYNSGFHLSKQKVLVMVYRHITCIKLDASHKTLDMA